MYFKSPKFYFRAERIQSDLIYFLGDASKAYNNHFSNELRGMSDSPMGPTVIIFHETKYTSKLQGSSEPGGKSPERILEDHFSALDQVYESVAILSILRSSRFAGKS